MASGDHVSFDPTPADLDDAVGEPTDAGSAAADASLHAKTRLLIDVYAATTGSATSGSTTTLVDTARTETTNQYFRGQMLVMTSGNADRQGHIILDYNGTTKTFTVAPAFTAAVAASDGYAVIPADFSLALAVALNASGITIATNSIADQLYIGAAEQLRNFIAKTGGTAAASGKALADMIGHTGSAFLTSGIGNSIWQSEAATPIADASVGSGATENLLDKGADAGTPRYRLDSALCNVASMGSNTQITFRVQAEINGTLTTLHSDTVGANVRTATGAFDLLSVLGITVPPAARHIRVTVTGNNAANDGSVAATFVTSKGGN